MAETALATLEMKRTPLERPSGSWAFGALVLFVFVVYANPGKWFDDVGDLPFAKIAAALTLMFLVGSWLLYGRRWTLGGWAGGALVALFGLVGFSALWSYYPKLTIETFQDGLKYLAIFVAVVNLLDSEPRLGAMFSALSLATVIPAIGCISSWMRGVHLVDGNRAAWIGIFGNPNELAYHLAVGIPLVLTAREQARTHKWKLFYLALLVPIGFAILLTQSRGGMLAASLVTVLWLLRERRRTSTIIGVALTALFLFSLSPNNPWTTRQERSVAFGVDVSARGRVDAWRTGLNIAAQRPLTGIGAGAFMVAWADYSPGDAGPARTAHNTFIQLVSELGLPGLGLFVCAFAVALAGLGRVARRGHCTLEARGIQCALVGFAMCSLTAGIAFSWPFYLLMGMALAVWRIARREEAAT